jgi:hypothetical protein
MIISLDALPPDGGGGLFVARVEAARALGKGVHGESVVWGRDACTTPSG